MVTGTISLKSVITLIAGSSIYANGTQPDGV
jgi:hypothetical protein